MTTTTESLKYTEPVAALLTLGEVSARNEWRDYLALGFSEADVPELCRMLLDRDLFWADSDSDEVWSALHAWRTLAQLKAESAIPALIELLGRHEEYDDDWSTDELPMVFGYIGPTALDPLIAFLADAENYMWARSTAARSIVEIGQQHPEIRNKCIDAISNQLAHFDDQDPTLNGLLIGCLIDLKAVEAAPVIEQAFAADQVDLMLQGDWEEVQIDLGLLTERQSPPPDYRKLMAEQMGFDVGELIDNFELRTTADPLAQAKAQQRAQRKVLTRAKKKVKNKRKAAKKMRKKQRKRR